MQADRLLLKNPLPRPLQMAVEKLLRTQVAQRLLNMRLQTLSRTGSLSSVEHVGPAEPVTEAIEDQLLCHVARPVKFRQAV